MCDEHDETDGLPLGQSFWEYVFDDPKTKKYTKAALKAEPDLKHMLINRSFILNCDQWPVSYSVDDHLKAYFNTSNAGEVLQRLAQGRPENHRHIKGLFELIQKRHSEFLRQLKTGDRVVCAHDLLEEEQRIIPGEWWGAEGVWIDFNKGSLLEERQGQEFNFRISSVLGSKLQADPIFQDIRIYPTGQKPDALLSEQMPLRFMPAQTAKLESDLKRWIADQPEYPKQIKKDVLRKAQEYFPNIAEKQFLRAWEDSAPLSWRVAGRPKKQMKNS